MELDRKISIKSAQKNQKSWILTKQKSRTPSRANMITFRKLYCHVIRKIRMPSLLELVDDNEAKYKSEVLLAWIIYIFNKPMRS